MANNYKRFPVAVWQLFEDLFKTRLTAVNGRLTALESSLNKVAASEVADALTNARTINGISFDGSEDISDYGICLTAADQTAKVVAVANFERKKGSRVRVRFDFGNTATQPTLNVNNTGAYSIKYGADPISPTSLVEDGTYEFAYNGEWYELVGSLGKIYEDFTPATNLVNGTSGLVPAPSAGAGTGMYLDATGHWTTPTNTTYTNFTPAKSTSAGTAGLVPAPQSGTNSTMYLNATGTWTTPPNDNTTYTVFRAATSTTTGYNGLVPAPAQGQGSNVYLNGAGQWTTPQNTTYSNFTGATTSSDGTAGLVPAPTASIQELFLKSDGTWSAVSSFTDTERTNSQGLKFREGIIAALRVPKSMLGDNYDKHGLVLSETADQHYLSATGEWTIPKDTTYSNFTGATSSASGTAGLVPAPSSGSQEKFLKADGTWATPEGTTYSNFTGATSSAAGSKGLVPAPTAGNQEKFLKANGTWATPTDTTYSNFTGATSSSSGSHGLVPAPSAGNQEKFLKANGTWATPTDTTYSNFTGATSSAAGTAGLVPAPTTTYAGKYFLNSDGTWKGLMESIPLFQQNQPPGYPGTSGFVRIGIPWVVYGNSTGDVPSSSVANKYFLRADGGWYIPPDTTYSNFTGATSSSSGSHGLVPAPSAGNQEKFLKANGTWATPTDTTYSTFTGATSSSSGSKGLVPAPSAGNQEKFLKADGTWATPAGETYSTFTGATSSAAGTAGLVPAPTDTQYHNRLYLRSDGIWASLISGLPLFQSNTSGYGGDSLARFGIPWVLYKENVSGFVPSASVADQYFLRADGGWYIPPNTTYSNFTGATSSTAGTTGLVPAPTTTYAGKYFLSSNGTWTGLLAGLPLFGSSTSGYPAENSMARYGIPYVLYMQNTPGKVPSASVENKYFLRADGGWYIPPDTTYSNFTGATSSASGTAGLVPAPSSGSQEKFLKADGTWDTPAGETYSTFTGATASAAGTTGLVPAPATNARTRYLRGDGSWGIPTDTQYSNFTGATASAAGHTGLVPAPAALTVNTNSPTAVDTRFLCADGTWKSLTVGNTNSAAVVGAGVSTNESIRYLFRQPETEYEEGEVVYTTALSRNLMLVVEEPGQAEEAGVVVSVSTSGIDEVNITYLFHQTSLPYLEGEMVKSMDLPTYMSLEAVNAGTTGSTAPTIS